MVSRMILFCTFISFSCTAFASGDIGKPAPSLIIKELNGTSFDLKKQHGKVVLVNFWAEWCPDCRTEMPALNAFYQHHKNRNVDMIGLSVDRINQRDKVVQISEQVSYPIAMLNEAEKSDFDIPSAIPVTYVIDKHGVVSAILSPDKDAITEENLNRVIAPLLTK